MREFLDFRCARCGSRDTMNLLYNRPHGAWLCRACTLLDRHKDAKTTYHAEDYDEPIGQPRDPVYTMTGTRPRGFRGRRVA